MWEHDLPDNGARLRNLVRVRLARRARHQCRGLLVANELLGVWIPMEITAKHQGNVTQVTRRHGAMMRDHIRNRLLAIFQALKEVNHVVTWFLAFIKNRDPLSQLLVVDVGQFVDGRPYQFAAVDENAALIALQEDTVAKVGPSVIWLVVMIDVQDRIKRYYKISKTRQEYVEG